jgi:glycosyltransferase involved in cell wall biosynthesis
MNSKISFTAWNITKRSKVLAEYTKAKIISYQIPTNRFLKLFNYPFLILLTFYKLIQQRPSIIFTQLPPFQISLPTYLYCKLFRKKLIFDTHSGIFFPKGIHQNFYLLMYCQMIKHINLNIVHNDSILNRACLKNSNSIVLEDKIPFSPSSYKPNPHLKIVVICGYGADEPINAVLIAAQLLPDIDFYLTGKSNKLKSTLISKNVQLTGYLDDTEYENLLRTADIIIVLTTRPDTVLCGAYEAVSVEKPLITSDTQIIKKYFYKGTIFTVNNTESIAQAITEARKNLDKLHTEMASLRKEKELTWQKQFEPVAGILNS